MYNGVKKKSQMFLQERRFLLCDSGGLERTGAEGAQMGASNTHLRVPGILA